MERELGGAANFLLQARRLGLAVGIIDSVGDDEAGRFYVSSLNSESVDVSRVLVKAGSSTSHSIVLVDKKGNHAYIGIHGVGWHITRDQIDPDYIRNSRTLYVDGYTLRGSVIRKAVLRALRIAFKLGIPIFFDPNPPLSEIPRETLREVISLCDIILPNDREAKAMAKAPNIKSASKKLLRLGPSVVAIKRGADGCCVCTRDGCENVSAFPVKVIDTTGAGDAFNAAFLYGQLRKWPLEKTATFANAVAAIKVTKLGGGRHVATRDEIIRFLVKHKISLNKSEN